MGLINLVEEVAGAVAAVKGVEALDSNAGFLEKGIAAVAGFKGVGMIKQKLAENTNETTEALQTADSDQTTRNPTI